MKNEKKWKKIAFSDAFEINPKVDLVKGRIYPFINMDAMNQNNRNVFRSEYREYTGSGSKFISDDTLMARITPCLENGKIAGYKSSEKEEEIAFGSTEFIVIRGKKGLTDNTFAYYVTRWMKFRNYAIAQMTGSSGRQRIPVDSLKGFSFYLPPLPTQEQIADTLSTLDNKIELNQQMNETLEGMARAIFKSWFVDFDPVYAKMEGRDYPLPAEIMNLFPNELVDSELGLIPKGWRVSKIDDVIETVGGGTPSTNEPEYWDNGVYHFATPKDLSNLRAPILINTERKVTDAGFGKISSGLLEKGTLLMSSRAPVGYLAITDIPVCINQGFIAMKCKKNLSNFYMLNWAKHNLLEIKGRASGTTFTEINKRNFRIMEVLEPPQYIVQEYDRIVASVYEKIILNLHENIALEKIRDTLLPELLTNGNSQI